jgi:hypothetical protein
MMIRRLLETRNERERILLTAFLWAGVLLWAAILAGSTRKGLTALKIAKAEAREQRFLMAEKDDIEARLVSAKSSIDSAKTLGALKLSSAVDDLARQAGMVVSIASPVRKASSIFNTYSVRVSCRNTSLEQLFAFTQAVRKQAPYLSIRRFKMNADQRDNRRITAEFEIESFELNQSLSQ